MRSSLHAGLLLLSTFFAAVLAHGQQAPPPAQNLITIDASTPIPPPETGYLHLGGTSSTGHSLQVNSRYLVLDGKPWLPVMGELHYTRIPEAEWEPEILKMKAGGINIISTYVFWIHHEEIQGQFDWTGRRNLRRFVSLCAKHGMYVWLRPGPWAHGEVRNGGFPDWLNKLPNLRSNDPVYLSHVATFFNQIGLQLHGLMFKDGGPVIGAQLENEYGLHGPGRGTEHILKLKQLAIAAGIDPPLFSVTGWPSLDFPPQEVIPVSGGYPDGFWYGSQTALPPSITYLFNFNRELGDMGATVPSEDPSGKVNLNHDPYFAAEEAGGMATAYHRRPVIAPDDIAAQTLTGIGSGINLYGYYMFHGGENPQGKLTTLQESSASGYPNDLPELDYDFQAPIGAFGQLRASYRKTRLLHLFLNAYGSDLATMPAFAPSRHTRDPADTSTPRVAVRSDGSSGFVFVNNYVRQLNLPARPNFQLDITLPTGKLAVPSNPINIPANSYFAWPFNLMLGRARLQYSTAQLLTRLDTPQGKLVVFFALPSIAPEFCFDAGTVQSISAPTATSGHLNGSLVVSNLQPGMNATITVTDAGGSKTTILLLSEQQAEQITLLETGGGKHLALSSSTVFFDGSSIHLRSTTSPTQQIALLPDLHVAASSPDPAGLWTTHTFTQPEQHPTLDIQETQGATPRAAMDMGPVIDWRKTSVPTVPPDSAFAQAATWQLQVKDPNLAGLSELFLNIDYSGDIGRVSGKVQGATTLLDDNFYNGLPWQIGLIATDTTLNEPLTLSILPLPKIAPIYLDNHARALIHQSPKNPHLANATLIPEYESILPLLP
jgi:beta-galactosidase